VADAVRRDPANAYMCTALDTELKYCEPIATDDKHAIELLEPDKEKGLGHHLHVFEYWIAIGRDRNNLDAITPNASVVFSTAPIASLHMPDRCASLTLLSQSIKLYLSLLHTDTLNKE
jgi:hypothetical protein